MFAGNSQANVIACIEFITVDKICGILPFAFITSEIFFRVKAKMGLF